MNGAEPMIPEDVIQCACDLARALLVRAQSLQTPAERRQQAELDRMLQTPADKATLVALTDQAFRSSKPSRVAEQFSHILDVQGIPRFFSPMDRALMRGFQAFGGWLPGVSVPMVKEHMRHETANVVLPAETELLTRHLRERAAEGARMNLNFLGEALLGEKEAQHRLDKYLAALQLPEVEVLSVKISTLYSQITPIAREQTLRVLCERLELLYRAALRARYSRPDGTHVSKFVYLDMEEYRDLQLTAHAFMRTLDNPALREARAGIALQAYIPDSAQMQREINTWARHRVAAGASPVTVRIVKGANMEMERVEASQRDWPQAPFRRKLETDANYKQMLAEALRPENLAAVHIGVASHNLFDLALGLVLAGDDPRVQFEMLEGMANHQRRALRERTSNLLLYAPACAKSEFLNAIGYLIRRMDENTGEENFLRHTFKLTPDSSEWTLLEQSFRKAFATSISITPRRTQNRATERFDSARDEMTHFENEADTDWVLPKNGEWAASLLSEPSGAPLEIPLVLAGEDLQPTSNTAKCTDPSRPGTIVAHYRQATAADIERAVLCAQSDPDGWGTLSVNERNQMLGKVAREIRSARGSLMRAALMNTGKTLMESDPEVSEAVDFVEFYRSSAREFFSLDGLDVSPRGVAVVVPPWNFPIAIPCGGIAAALSAGNRVILKPSSDAVFVAWELCLCFWRAGVPRTALQFLPCPGSSAGSKLVTHPLVDSVILTGGTETALRMLDAKPAMRLFAETGGKNATIITALSDRELAVKHVVQSAFGHSGQKCSATSLLLLEAEIYDDPGFKQMLCDAVQSLAVGSAWELATRLGPCIRPPSGDLETALKTLEKGETWAVMPRPSPQNPAIWSPAVKYGVQPGSVTHCTEFFGPVLGVMRFERLEEAIQIVNATGYGLTSAIHSLDQREIALWKQTIRAGNLYINRGTTGAIVLRQPFGGMGRSCLGAAMKAGGPNYVAQFLQFKERECAMQKMAPSADVARLCSHLTPLLPAEDAARLARAAASYAAAWENEFSKEHDHFRLIGQDNIRRYLPFREVRVRVHPADSPFEIAARIIAGRTLHSRIIVSTDSLTHPLLPQLQERTRDWGDAIQFIAETESQLIAEIKANKVDRIRVAAPERIHEALRRAAAAAFIHIADDPVLAEGRIELLWYLREQSISHDYHRYGNLGQRAMESRRETL